MKDTMQNLQIFSDSQHYLEKLTSFGIIEKGYFEYKGKSSDGSRLRGEYFVNFRKLSTSQEIVLSPLYWNAIEEFFADKISDLIIVGVAFGSLSLPKVIQTLGYEKYGIEYAYTEKRNGELGIFGEQLEKCKGKHVLFIEDVFNNGTSCKELLAEMQPLKQNGDIKGFSLLYGVHRGHTFLPEPSGEIYAMSKIFAPAFHKNDTPDHLKDHPLKEYKK